jgi:hypothetical protein
MPRSIPLDGASDFRMMILGHEIREVEIDIPRAARLSVEILGSGMLYHSSHAPRHVQRYCKFGLIENQSCIRQEGIAMAFF